MIWKMTKRLAANEPPGLPWPLRPQGDLPDTNVWLALAAEEHPQHAAARAYWAGAHASGAGDVPFLWFCRVTMLGMVRLLCQPRKVGTGAIGLARAMELYNAFRALPYVGLLPDAEGCEDRLEDMLAFDGPLQPRLWTHAYLAALAQSAGLRLVSFDSRFQIFGAEHCLILPSS
jgi:toxin-antitoxin system PIN domain toxin